MIHKMNVTDAKRKLLQVAKGCQCEASINIIYYQGDDGKFIPSRLCFLRILGVADVSAPTWEEAFIKLEAARNGK